MRLMIHTLCTNHYLDLIITFIICINVITMSLEHYNQPHVRGNVNSTCVCKDMYVLGVQWAQVQLCIVRAFIEAF